MKATLRMPGAFVILLLFAPAATAQGEDASAEEETIQRTLVAMWDAIENGDIDRYASDVHPDFRQRRRQMAVHPRPLHCGALNLEAIRVCG